MFFEKYSSREHYLRFFICIEVSSRRGPSIGAGGHVPPQSPRWGGTGGGGTAVGVAANTFYFLFKFFNKITRFFEFSNKNS